MYRVVAKALVNLESLQIKYSRSYEAGVAREAIEIIQLLQRRLASEQQAYKKMEAYAKKFRNMLDQTAMRLAPLDLQKTVPLCYGCGTRLVLDEVSTFNSVAGKDGYFVEGGDYTVADAIALRAALDEFIKAHAK